MPPTATLQSQSSPSTPKGGPYILEDDPSLHVTLEEDYKTYLTSNLEVLLIGHSTETAWPQHIKTAIADTIIRGRYKYHDTETRIHRVIHHSTLTVGDAVIAKLPCDTYEHSRAAIIHEALIAALDRLLVEDAFQATTERLRELLHAASGYEFSFDPAVPSRLGAVTTIIRDVVANSTRPAGHTIDILLTAITGIPCRIEIEENIGVIWWHDYQVKNLANRIIFTLILRMREALTPIAAAPGRRWKLIIISKLAYVHKTSQRNGHLVADGDILYTLSKIDIAHAMLETGVSLKPAGKKICFVAPNSLTIAVTRAIADIYDTHAATLASPLDGGQDYSVLFEEDFRDMEESSLKPEYGQWISLSVTGCFSRTTLADFITRQGVCWDRVAANRRGDTMFFVEGFGPWMPPKDVSIHFEAIAELLRQTVQGYPIDTVANRRFRWKKPRQPVTMNETVGIYDEDDEHAGQKSFYPCTYKPRTLEAVINKPGRVL